MKRHRLVMTALWADVFLASAALTGRGGEVVLETPSDDRWHYPFNFNPGRRPFASCFGSTSDPNYTTFNDRDGIFLIAWRTDEVICPDLPPGSYDITSIRVTLTGPAGADWDIDLTADPWFHMVYPIADVDPGQPLELFGVGFGPDFTYENWTEFSFYVGGDDQGFAERDPFPFVFEEPSGNRLHVEDSVKDQFTPTPWSIGLPEGYSPGGQTTPFPVHFDVDLALSGGRVRRYFQEQLSGGRVAVAVTSLALTFKQAQAGFPTFYTKEGAALDPNAQPPQLTIVILPSADLDGDGRRDRDDWPEMRFCLDGPESAPPSGGALSADGCLCLYDLDEDGDVDLRDVDRFQRRFNGGS